MTADGGYYASGLFGQMCIIWPALQAVVVTTAGLQPRDRRLYQAIATHLVPALQGGADRNDDALAARLRSLALPDKPAGEPQAKRAAAISGRSWTIAPNEDGVARMQLRFESDRCVFTLIDARGTHRIDAGLHAPIEGTTTMTGAKLHHGYEPDSLRVVAQGAWATPDRFVMTWRYVETAFCDTVVCSFTDDEMRLERSVNTNSSASSRPPLTGR
jgi:hypothetical protein